MGAIFVSEDKKKTCWNHYETLYFCIYCGCCDKDKRKRYKARVDFFDRTIKEFTEFSKWSDDEEVRKKQEQNIKANIEWARRGKMNYTNKLKELENERT